VVDFNQVRHGKKTLQKFRSFRLIKKQKSSDEVLDKKENEMMGAMVRFRSTREVYKRLTEEIKKSDKQSSRKK
jgi:hypothetical protein